MKVLCCSGNRTSGATYYGEAYRFPIVAGGFMRLRTGLEMLSDGILWDVPLAHMSVMYW